MGNQGGVAVECWGVRTTRAMESPLRPSVASATISTLTKRPAVPALPPSPDACMPGAPNLPVEVEAARHDARRSCSARSAATHSPSCCCSGSTPPSALLCASSASYSMREAMKRRARAARPPGTPLSAPSSRPASADSSSSSGRVGRGAVPEAAQRGPGWGGGEAGRGGWVKLGVGAPPACTQQLPARIAQLRIRPALPLVATPHCLPYLTLLRRRQQLHHLITLRR